MNPLTLPLPSPAAGFPGSETVWTALPTPRGTLSITVHFTPMAMAPKTGALHQLLPTPRPLASLTPHTPALGTSCLVLELRACRG